MEQVSVLHGILCETPHAEYSLQEGMIERAQQAAPKAFDREERYDASHSPFIISRSTIEELAAGCWWCVIWANLLTPKDRVIGWSNVRYEGDTNVSGKERNYTTHVWDGGGEHNTY